MKQKKNIEKSFEKKKKNNKNDPQKNWKILKQLFFKLNFHYFRIFI